MLKKNIFEYLLCNIFELFEISLPTCMEQRDFKRKEKINSVSDLCLKKFYFQLHEGNIFSLHFNLHCKIR